MFEPRKKAAVDGKEWWCVWDTDKKDWSTVTCFGKYRTKKACQFVIDQKKDSLALFSVFFKNS